MGRVINFAKLDFLTVKPFLSPSNLMGFLVIFVFIGLSSSILTMSGVLMMYAAIYTSYPFAVGEKNSIDTLYATLPLEKKDIVTGRYIFAIMLNVLLALIILLILFILSISSIEAVNLTEALVSVVSCFIIASFVESLQLPIYFKLGYAKAKFLAYFPIFICSITIAFIPVIFKNINLIKILNNLYGWIFLNPLVATIVIFIAWLMVMALSCYISYSLYKNREF
ncbi:MAG: ABC-2 transporter permease [Clostridiales bacterium]|jgi:hypothetical protein|nr:ABC-2 transporter permease [Clostridiales bacterium]